jgi:hypothetical protein
MYLLVASMSVSSGRADIADPTLADAIAFDHDRRVFDRRAPAPVAIRAPFSISRRGCTSSAILRIM